MTTIPFIFLFLPLSLAIYYIAGQKAKEYALLAISLAFYSMFSLEYIALFIIEIILTVTIGRLINRNKTASSGKALLVTGIVLNVVLLAFYKYFNSIMGLFASGDEIPSIALPLGISFFTFKAISYLTDVYKGTAELSANPVHDALYLSFFPQVQAGPITRYSGLSRFDRINSKVIIDGFFRFLIGFCKKVLISNVLSKITIEVFSAPLENFSVSYAWIGSICFSLQLLFDFAGYSDMAIGISQMFGYHCMENFDYPYMTESVSRFWRRWHISLSQWFRDYIYIPMGGSRTKNKWRVYFNLLVVWVLTGIWHGSTWNFVIWGLGYFAAISFERLTGLPDRFKHKWAKFIYRILSLLFINLLWVLFNSDNIGSGLGFIKRMFVCPHNELADLRTLFFIRNYGIFILAAVILCFPLVPFLEKKLKDKKAALIVFKAASAVIIIFSFIWSLSFVMAGLNNPFAYGNF